MLSAINETKYQESIENYMIPVSLEKRQEELDEHLARYTRAAGDSEVVRNVREYHKRGDCRYRRNFSLKLPVFPSQKEAAIFLYQLMEYWLQRDVHFGGVDFSWKCLSFKIELSGGWSVCDCIMMLRGIFGMKSQGEVFDLPFVHRACYHRNTDDRRITEESLWEFIHQ